MQRSEIAVRRDRRGRMLRGRSFCSIVAFGLVGIVVLAGCTRPTPGLPRVWPGQAVSPNVQTRNGDLITLTLRATNDSTNRDNGDASKVRTITALPPGVTVLGFTSSDAGRLAPDDPERAWVEQIDTRNHVVVVSFGRIGSQQQKTGTLTLRVDAPAGTTLSFRTMLVWSNAASDTYECDLNCIFNGLKTETADEPQLRAYVDDHQAEIQALLKTYPGGGGAEANAVDILVGDHAINSTAPLVALLAASDTGVETRLTTKPAFTPGEPVMLWYNRPDLTAIFLWRTDVFEDGSINFGVSKEAWAAIPADATSIIARGQYSGVEALYLFNRP